MKSNYKRIGDYIRPLNVKNTDLKAKELLGINIDKFFMPSVANVVGTDLSKYKVVEKNQFACNRMHVGRDYRIPISCSDKNEPFMVSPAYDVFEIKDTKVLNPEFLMMWFSRKEFDRNAWFYTDADVRGGLSWKSFSDMQLPIPHPDKQQEIVKEYNTIQNRINLNQQLIQKLEETAQAIYREWFVDGIDLENLPEGWSVGQLEEIKLSTLGGDWGKDNPIDNYNKEVYCIRGTDIPTSNIGQRGNLPTRFILSKNLINRKLEPFDIVIEISGGSPTQSTGRSVLLTTEYLEYLSKDIICSNFCRVIKAKQNYSIFLFSTIGYLYNANVFFTYENSSNGVKNLAIDDLFKEQLIPIPDTNTLNSFNKAFQKIYRHILIIGKENEKLSDLKELLLSKLATVE